MRPTDGKIRLVRLAALFYAATALVSVIWGAFVGSVNVLWKTPPTLSVTIITSAWGIGFGLFVVALTRLTQHQRWAVQLTQRFRELLGPLTWKQSALLALFSSIGEEMLFRGAIQRSWGLWPATALFALAHFPTERAFIPWTAMAGVIGLALGYNVYWAENIIGAIVAHFVINLLNLHHVASSKETDMRPNI